MGLGGGGGNKVFISIINGAFTVRVTEETPGAIKRLLQKGINVGKPVWELKFTELSGMISSVEFVKKEFGNQIEIVVTDDKEYVLQIPWGAFGLRDSFIKRMPNINPDKPVKLVAFKGKSDGRTAFLVSQDNEWLKLAFTKDNPNGMPQATEKESIGGEIEWDFAEVEKFMYEVLEKEKTKFKQKQAREPGDEVYEEDVTYGEIAMDEEPPF